MTRLVVVDADILVYYGAWAVQFSIAWPNGSRSTAVGPFGEACRVAEAKLRDILRRTRAKDYVLAFSDNRDFRYKVSREYQLSRADRPQPEHKAELLDYLKLRHPHQSWPWLEADDVLGIMATEGGRGVVMATVDKDLLQIPGTIYFWNRDKTVHVSEEDGDIAFFCQALAGDPVDDIRGAPGIGPVRAKALLEPLRGKDHDTLWAKVLEAYAERGLSESYALEQARLVRILRSGEYDMKTHTPKLYRS